jgi:hypothetical protein
MTSHDFSWLLLTLFTILPLEIALTEEDDLDTSIDISTYSTIDCCQSPFWTMNELPILSVKY